MTGFGDGREQFKDKPTPPILCDYLINFRMISITKR